MNPAAHRVCATMLSSLSLLAVSACQLNSQSTGNGLTQAPDAGATAGTAAPGGGHAGMTSVAIAGTGSAGTRSTTAGQSATGIGHAGSGSAGVSAGSGATAGDGIGPAAGSGATAGVNGSAGASGRHGGAGRGAAGRGAAGSGGHMGPRAGSGGHVGPSSGSGGHAGGAGSGSTRCGTRGGVQCSDSAFCNFEPDPNCGATDRGGVCEAVPTGCTNVEAPVCGCDNVSYRSSCYAHVAGVSVKAQGLCGADECRAAGGRVVTSDGTSQPACNGNEDEWTIGGGQQAVLCCVPQRQQNNTCGGIASLKCANGEFCDFEKSAGGQGCDGAVSDPSGTCQPITQNCTSDYAPICGCDHKTYPNACTAHSKGVSVWSLGTCNDTGGGGDQGNGNGNSNGGGNRGGGRR